MKSFLALVAGMIAGFALREYIDNQVHSSVSARMALAGSQQPAGDYEPADHPT